MAPVANSPRRRTKVILWLVASVWLFIGWATLRYHAKASAGVDQLEAQARPVDAVLADELRRFGEEQGRDSLLFWAVAGLLVAGMFGGVLIGVQRRFRSHDALLRSEDRLQKVINSMPQGLLITDEQGTLLHWNQALVKMNGEWILKAFDRRMDLLTLSTPDGELLPVERWPLQRLIRGETIRDEEWVVASRQDDQRRVLRFNGSVVRDRDERPLYYLWISDVTERYEAQLRLQRQQNEIKALFDLVPAMIWHKDTHNRILRANQRVAAALGRPIREIEGRACEDLYPTEAAALFAEDLQVIRTGVPLLGKVSQSVNATGQVQWLHTDKVPYLDEQGEVAGIVVMSHDITESKRISDRLAAEQDRLKKLEDELRHLNADLEQRVAQRTTQLEAANAELEAFSYSVSHDLRAPLRAVDGFSQALQEDYGPVLAEEGQGYLRVIRNETQRMGQLIDDLLTFSRLSRASMAKHDVDVESMVAEILSSYTHAIAERKIDLVVGPLPPALADRSLIRQVWINLLSNAFKYTSKTLHPRIEVGATSEGGVTVYFVKDNGAGFDMRYVHKIFGVFQRLHRAEDYQGTGVGLAIVQRIVHRHGGFVRAEGSVNQGATFSFSLAERSTA